MKKLPATASATASATATATAIATAAFPTATAAFFQGFSLPNLH